MLRLPLPLNPFNCPCMCRTDVASTRAPDAVVSSRHASSRTQTRLDGGRMEQRRLALNRAPRSESDPPLEIRMDKRRRREQWDGGTKLRQ